MRRRRRTTESSNLVRALALFVILTGAVAFVASLNGNDTDLEVAVASAPDPAISVALEHLEKASNALEATDYGRTRFHLHEARGTLSNALE